MRRSLVCLTVIGVASFLTTRAAQADLIYGFETGDAAGPTDGFGPGSGPVTQANVGVTQGSNSLEAQPEQGTGYTIDALAATTYVPTALTLANSVSYSLTVDASHFGYLQIFPTFDIKYASGNEYFLSSSTGNQVNLGGQTLTGAPQVLMNLAVFSDPDASEDGDNAGTYTVGQIIANDAPYEGSVTATTFQLDYQDSGTSDGSSVPFYLDDFEVASTPEPASLSLIGLGGIVLMRRRRPR
jgi:hypothetical protein